MTDTYRDFLKQRHDLERQLLAYYRQMMEAMKELILELEEDGQLPENWLRQPSDTPEEERDKEIGRLHILDFVERDSWEVMLEMNEENKNLLASYQEAKADFQKCEEALKRLS